MKNKEFHIEKLDFKKIVKKTKEEAVNLLSTIIDNPDVKVKGIRIYYFEEKSGALMKQDLFLEGFNPADYEEKDKEEELTLVVEKANK